MSRSKVSGARDRVANLQHRELGIAAVSFTTIVWGLVPLVLKEVRMPTLGFAMYRLWLGVAIYGAVLLLDGRRLRWNVIRACALGGVFFGLDVSLTFNAFQITSVANATIIGALAPVFIALGAVRLFGERLERRDYLFMLLSFAGVALVAVGSAGSGDRSVFGDTLAFASTISWTAYWLFSKRARRDVTALEYMATVMLVAAVVVTVLNVVSTVAGVPEAGLRPPVGGDWIWIVLVAVLPGATGHWLVAWSHRHVEAWLASLITQCTPVVGSVAAWVLIGEALPPLVIAGGLIVLTATAAIVVKEARAVERDPAVNDLEPLSPDPSGG
ncbi:MAG: DMT family transporter [Actinomycetota bacterium]